MNSGHNDELILENKLFCSLYFISLLAKSLWNKGIILSPGCRQWLIFTFRGTMTDLDDQNPDIQSEKKTVRSGECGAGSEEQTSKEEINENTETVMDSLYTWEDLQTAADNHFPCHRMLQRCNLPRCDYISQKQKGSCCLLEWPCDTRTQMQKRRKYILKVGARELMPFGGKCDSVSTSGLRKQDGTASRSVWNTIVPGQLQISNFYSTEIGLCCRPL